MRYIIRALYVRWKYVMQDIVSINRQFLIMAREAAKLPSGEIITGLSRKTLDRLTELDLEQIEKVAQGVRASLISLRLSEADIDDCATSFL